MATSFKVTDARPAKNPVATLNPVATWPRLPLFQAESDGPYASPNSKCLARAQLRLAPSFVIRPLAAKRLDSQRSGGQIAGEAFARRTACARSAPVESQVPWTV
jgi:hypothetical protein